MTKSNVGYIMQLPNGKWQAIIEYPSVNNKRRRKRKTCNTEGEAKKVLIQLNKDRDAYIKRGEHLINVISFNEAVKVFKKTLERKVSVGELKKKSQLSYNQFADKLCRKFGEYQTNQITKEVFEDYLDDLLYDNGLSSSSLSKCKIVLNLIFKVNKIPELSIKKIKKTKKNNMNIRPLVRTERDLIDTYIQEKLSLNIGNKYKQWLIIFIYYFALYTGCREGEVAGLKWSAIREDEGIIIIDNGLVYIPKEGLFNETPKTIDSYRRLVVSKKVFELFRRLRKIYESYKYPISEYCFITRTGRPLFPRNILRDFQTMCKRAGLTNHHTFHDLRHTNITNKIIKGVDVKTVSLMAGHSDVEITLNTYSHYWREAMQRAANLEDDQNLLF